MAHRLLHKLPFSRNCSVCSAPISSGMPSGNTSVPLSQESPLSSSAVPRTSPTVHSYYSDPPMPLVALPPPDFSPSPGTRRPSQRVNLFKRLFGKQPTPLRLAPSKIRRRKTWERDLQEFRFNAGEETRDGNDRKSSPKDETPTSWELHWDCAKTEYRDSMEVRTPVFSDEGLALCDLPSPTDVLGPIDYRSVCLAVKNHMSKEIPSPGRRSIHAKDACLPIRSLSIAESPLSPSGYSINGAREQNVVTSSAISSLNEEEPRFSKPLSSPPKRKREPRRASLVFRPASSGGPAPQSLSPPPVKAKLALRRGTALPSRLAPAPPSRRRSRQSIAQAQLSCGSADNTSEPGNPASLTPEEGLIQLQVRTQRADSTTRLGYRRSFSHIRGLSPRTHPTSVVPINTHLDGSDDAEIRSRSKGSSIGSISESSSDESEPLITPPDDAIPDITVTKSRKGSNAPSGHLQVSECARADKYANSFLDFEPSTPRSPLSPATQSPFNVAQSQLLTFCGRCSLENVDASSEQSDAETSVKSYEEREQRDWGARRDASPIQSPGINRNPTRGSKARPGPSCLGTPYIDPRSNVYRSSDAMAGGGKIASAYRTSVVGQPQRRPKSGVRRSHRPRSRNGTTATRRRRNGGSSGIYGVTRGVDKDG